MLLTRLGWPRVLLALGASRSMAWGGARFEICTEGSPLSHSLHCHPYCLVFLGILKKIKISRIRINSSVILV